MPSTTVGVSPAAAAVACAGMTAVASLAVWWHARRNACTTGTSCLHRTDVLLLVLRRSSRSSWRRRRQRLRKARLLRQAARRRRWRRRRSRRQRRQACRRSRLLAVQLREAESKAMPKRDRVLAERVDETRPPEGEDAAAAAAALAPAEPPPLGAILQLVKETGCPRKASRPPSSRPATTSPAQGRAHAGGGGGTAAAGGGRAHRGYLRAVGRISTARAPDGSSSAGRSALATTARPAAKAAAPMAAAADDAKSASRSALASKGGADLMTRTRWRKSFADLPAAAAATAPAGSIRSSLLLMMAWPSIEHAARPNTESTPHQKGQRRTPTAREHAPWAGGRPGRLERRPPRRAAGYRKAPRGTIRDSPFLKTQRRRALLCSAWVHQVFWP